MANEKLRENRLVDINERNFNEKENGIVILLMKN